MSILVHKVLSSHFSLSYNLTPVAGIQKFIEENLIDARSEDELFEQSLRLEPRER